MTYPATNSNEAIELIIDGGNQLHQIINEDALTEVTTESGPVPSVRKAISDTFLFQEPITWQQGSNETAFNQLREFNNEIYWAPSATVVNPIPMRVTPVGDSNWKIAPISNKSYIKGEDTKSQEELLPPSSQIFPEIGALSDGDTVTEGATHLRVEIGGQPSIVTMSPVANGLVSDLTETSATIGGVATVFNNHSILKYIESSNGSAIENMISGEPTVALVGDICVAGGSTFKRVATSSPAVIGDFKRLTEVNILESGALGDWDGASGTDDTAAIQSFVNSLENVDILLPSGYTFRTQGILGKPGVKFVGGGRFYYEPNDVVVKTDYPKKAKRCYMYTWEIRHVEEFLQIKSLGFNTLIHYGQYYTGGNLSQTMNSLASTDMDIVMYHRTDASDVPEIDYDDWSQVIGYNLFDEPTQHGNFATQQQARIDAYRAVTNKDLYVVDNADNLIGSTGIWSPDWDVFLLDFYADSTLTYETQRAQLHRVWLQVKEACPRANITPAVGLFTLPPQFADKAAQIKLAKKLYHISKDGDFAVFGWNPNVTGGSFTDVLTDSDFMELAEDLTTKQSNSYEIDAVIFRPNSDPTTIAQLVRSYIGEYSVNMKTYSVENVGSATDARHSTFSWKGIGIANDGGIFATNLLSRNYSEARIEYENKFNAATATISIDTYLDDFFRRTKIYIPTLYQVVRNQYRIQF
ncbi:hypothetical protein VPIG_00173 [Vibrio phage PWH3a-P1]|uniref:hypothetical protein n=1 Tax=Vibrio phage PWH3a-P1 TaxID=754058 RepID=UPI0002C0EEDF|nr:hypothetical protein VPIG_00173 [Vibrio phage PWH3a-P1]AGH32030.1 hypothetical protein VPIG_00173 [Vibrio phage PWH3a-P1]